jgi:hypothetical protein
MYVRILLFLVAVVVLAVLLRNVYRDASQRLKELLPRRRLRPRVVEEPKSRVETVKGKMVLRVILPNVASSADVKVKKLSRSIEVRAYAGNKVYFKLFPIPPGAKLVSARMEKDEYIIELSSGGG